MNVWVCAAPDISSRLRADTQRKQEREEKNKGRERKREKDTLSFSPPRELQDRFLQIRVHR